MAGTSVIKELNALLIVYIHRDIFLDYDKIIDICVSKYPRRMLLINPLSEKETVETLNARKTYKAYKNFAIFSLYVVVVICKHFSFASTN